MTTIVYLKCMLQTKLLQSKYFVHYLLLHSSSVSYIVCWFNFVYFKAWIINKLVTQIKFIKKWIVIQNWKQTFHFVQFLITGCFTFKNKSIKINHRGLLNNFLTKMLDCRWTLQWRKSIKVKKYFKKNFIIHCKSSRIHFTVIIIFNFFVNYWINF